MEGSWPVHCTWSSAGWGKGPSCSKTWPRSRQSIQPPHDWHLMKCSASSFGGSPTSLRCICRGGMPVICPNPLPPPASPQVHPIRRAARSGGEALSTKTKPRRLRGLAIQHTGRRGIGGDRGHPNARLMNVSRASFGEVQRSLAELRVMHRWRTELFRHLVHSLEVDLCVAEQRQIDLSAHRGHVGLRPLRIEPSDPCPTRHPKR